MNARWIVWRSRRHAACGSGRQRSTDTEEATVRTNRRAQELLLAAARLGLAHSFFGQLYEAVVDIPARITREPQQSPFDPSSPTRYFLPVAPVTRVALAAGVALSWRRPGRRGRLLVALGATAGETATTVYLVRRVNPRLFLVGYQASVTDRPELLRRWHRLNVLRLATAAAAWIALSGMRPPPSSP